MTATTAQADSPAGVAGDYLAARTAFVEQDFVTAARYFDAALSVAPTDPKLLENGAASHLGMGDFDGAALLALALVDQGVPSQLCHMIETANFVRQERWDGVFNALEAGRTVGPLVDGLAQAWAFVGKGDMPRALIKFDEVAETPGLRPFGLYHKAAALAGAGEYDAALEILQMRPDEGMQRTRRSLALQVAVLSQLGRNDAATDLIDRVFGAGLDATFADLRARLDAGDRIEVGAGRDAVSGFAEIYYSVAGAIDGETSDDYVLYFARVASILDPENTAATLLAADILDRLERHGLAEATYRSIPDDSAAFAEAERGRAGALARSGEAAAAIEVLQALARVEAGPGDTLIQLGTLLRHEGRLADAEAVFGAAIEALEGQNGFLWYVHYSRGVVRHELGDWAGAEADLRAALKLNPEQPQVLNYLGYALADRKERLDEALTLIETAAAADPQNGAIIDSLGWVLFNLGDHEEAVGHLEHAVELLPVNATINDHLGDAYWSVGRRTEARFQWQRALSLGGDGIDAAAIEAKLRHGLMAVIVPDAELALAADDGN